jgi:hypothetical protein
MDLAGVPTPERETATWRQHLRQDPRQAALHLQVGFVHQQV